MSPHCCSNIMDDSSSVSSSTYTSEPVVNGVSNASAAAASQYKNFSKSRHLRPTPSDEIHDLVCVGFGPASISVAIATHDAIEAGKLSDSPKVLFLEKQADFAWHAGMLLPGAKMQISFIKDLASLRDPRSHFTFLNYLHQNERLVDFINLSTFTPARIEFEDYLRWCARHFDDVVRYQTEVVAVEPVQSSGPNKLFTITSRNIVTGDITTYQARNVLLALGGQASIPKSLPQNHPRVIHSSQYASVVPKLLSDQSAPVRVAVLGAGQSAAEIFSNVQNLYPNSKTFLIMRSEFMKPSDDSPFVNSIFNPDFIDTIHSRPSAYRSHFLADAKATNYGVVRLELIEHLYEIMYHQRRVLGTDETQWPHRIMAARKIVSVSDKGDKLKIKVGRYFYGEDETATDGPIVDEETLDVDVIICATGYQRTAHVDMLKPTWPLLPEADAALVAETVKGSKDRWFVEGEEKSLRVIEANRDYSVKFGEGKVAQGSGIWLQGCCEGTHGLSDTLLSVLSTRSGEIVKSIFGA
ncbi:L-lysine 6-monooxygenase (NADPH-requiring)-domain-containing protein [Copromyces sp. CBS 386.78]|nr:L-lysine 6-monooxygenase (NADPH-requiring)-domain-containing protein [Copromyces sp. CBS 386.78]